MSISFNLKNKQRGLALLTLTASMLAISLPSHAEPAPDDPFLRGYIAAILDRELKWERGSYLLDVHNGIATITLPEENPVRTAEARSRIGPLNGLSGLTVVTQNSGASVAEPSWRERVYDALEVLPQADAFPANDLFAPLIADPKEPRFFMSARSYRTSVATVSMAAVGFGETFGFYRRPGKQRGDGLQLGISGGIMAQFNLDAPSSDLVNADYIIGLPVTYRHGPWSTRVRLYHQSSHLGDEFLLRVNPERVNLSYEAIDALVSYDWGPWRAYGGGEYIFHREPAELRPASLQGGLEYRGRERLWGLGRLVGGVDLKSHEEHDWAVDASMSVGLEFGDPAPGRRNMRLMFDGYRGYSPHGQFYQQRVSYYGLGLGFDF